MKSTSYSYIKISQVYEVVPPQLRKLGQWKSRTIHHFIEEFPLKKKHNLWGISQPRLMAMKGNSPKSMNSVITTYIPDIPSGKRLHN